MIILDMHVSPGFDVAIKHGRGVTSLRSGLGWCHIRTFNFLNLRLQRLMTQRGQEGGQVITYSAYSKCMTQQYVYLSLSACRVSMLLLQFETYFLPECRFIKPSSEAPAAVSHGEK